MALLLAVVTAGPLVHDGAASTSTWALDLALVLPLAARRRHPTGVFALLALLASVQWAVGLRLTADAGLLLALYTVAALEVRARAVAAGLVLEVGVVLASFRFAPTGDGVVGSLVFLTGLVVAAFLLGTSVQTRRAYLLSVEERARRLEVERDQQTRLVQVAERTRISREMHDVVAHKISVMIALSAGAAAVTGAAPDDAASAMRQVAQTGRDALGEMRQLLGLLRHDDGGTTGQGPQPGLQQLDDLLDQIRSTGLHVRVRVKGRPRDLSTTVQLTVYRAVQEALTNVLKHGHGATAAEVVMDWQPTTLELVVTDDGTQVQGPREPQAGLGLIGMQERARAAGGSAHTGSRADGGWVVRVRLPLQQDPG